VAACGPLAERLVGGISPDSPPLAREGFWGRLYDQDGNVLMLCRLRSATIFHTGETWLKLPQRNLIAHSLDANGQRRVHVMPNAPWHVDHFDKTMAQPLIRRGVMKVTRIGDDDAYLAPARAMVDMSLRVLRRNHALALGKDGACVCTHCTALRRGLANDAGRG
jgi:aminoglycoside N3'-acetyltransferase